MAPVASGTTPSQPHRPILPVRVRDRWTLDGDDAQNAVNTANVGLHAEFLGASG